MTETQRRTKMDSARARGRTARARTARRARRGALALVLAGLVGGAAPARAAEEAADEAAEKAAVDLVGTWFVLVHYRDAESANPDADRWEDKVWVFERKGSRLQWTEYPIVVLDDSTGRFESRGGNRRARVLASWEPNEAQLLDILQGPVVNSRGSKSKSMRGNDTEGYESFGSLRAQSAAVIGYHETWSVGSPTSLPDFQRADVMGMGRARRTGGDEQNVEGLTRYRTREVVSPDVLEGSYARDENRRGSFRMLRTAKIRGLPTDGPTPNEKLEQRTRQQIADEVRRRAQEGDPEAIQAVEEYMRSQRDRRP